MRAFHNLTANSDAVMIDRFRVQRPVYFSVSEWLDLWKMVEGICDGSAEDEAEERYSEGLREELDSALERIAELESELAHAEAAAFFPAVRLTWR